MQLNGNKQLVYSIYILRNKFGCSQLFHTHNVIKATLHNELQKHMLYNLSLAQPVTYDFL